MELRSTKDLVSGAVLAAFGVYVIIESARFSYLTEEGPGPGFLPLWLGIAMVGLSLCLVIINQRRAAPKALAKPGAWSGETRALCAWLALMAAILLTPLLGFTLCLVLLTLFIVAVLERRSLRSALAVALGLGLGFHVIFVVVLGLSLPPGPLGF
jgi:putative tricarboxylic transport membrane protein